MNEENDSDAETPVGAGVTLEEVRNDLDGRLPGMIENAIQRYRNFVHFDPPDESKNFAAYNYACRAALGHIDLLLKLAIRSSSGTPVSPTHDLPHDDVERLIANAEAALEKATVNQP